MTNDVEELRMRLIEVARDLASSKAPYQSYNTDSNDPQWLADCAVAECKSSIGRALLEALEPFGK